MATRLRQKTYGSIWRRTIALLPLAFFVCVEPASADDDAWATTFYVAQISGEEGWEDVMANPALSDYVEDYLAVAALSRRYARYYNGRMQLEAEGQVAYNFGQQHHWEFNAVPVVARWHWSPWQLATSTAVGIGLSYASEVPKVEVELEGESHQWLVYWVAEATAGPADGPWAMSLRLHHRSVAYGLFGQDGGMNGVGLGLRYRF